MPLTRVGFSNLTGDAWYSSDKLQGEFGFAPQHRMEEEFPRMVMAYLERRAEGTLSGN
jgi:UDP-glucose 4-epimerase